MLDHAITVCKSQGRILPYMQGDLNWSTSKKTAVRIDCQKLTSQYQFYTLLPCAKGRDEVLMLNFKPEDIR